MADPPEPRLHEDLTSQVALVTGANRGIGAEIARQLVALGATVYAGARDPGQVTAEDQLALRLDVTDDDEIQAAAARVADEAGQLDVLVNNAGIIGPRGPLAELELAEVDATLATDLRGPLAVTRAHLALLLEAEGPRVVNVSSGGGSFGEGMMTGHLPYAVSKAGLNALTYLLHGQYHDQGLLVNSVCPGWVRTDMGGHGAHRSLERGAETPVWLARLRPGSPSGGFWRDKARIPW